MYATNINYKFSKLGYSLHIIQSNDYE